MKSHQICQFFHQREKMTRDHYCIVLLLLALGVSLCKSIGKTVLKVITRLRLSIAYVRSWISNGDGVCNWTFRALLTASLLIQFGYHLTFIHFMLCRPLSQHHTARHWYSRDYAHQHPIHIQLDSGWPSKTPWLCDSIWVLLSKNYPNTSKASVLLSLTTTNTHRLWSTTKYRRNDSRLYFMFQSWRSWYMLSETAATTE